MRNFGSIGSGADMSEVLWRFGTNDVRNDKIACRSRCAINPSAMGSDFCVINVAVHDYVRLYFIHSFENSQSLLLLNIIFRTAHICWTFFYLPLCIQIINSRLFLIIQIINEAISNNNLLSYRSNKITSVLVVDTVRFKKKIPKCAHVAK